VVSRSGEYAQSANVTLMTIRRTLATASAALLLLVSLTACFGLPGLPGGGNPGGEPEPGGGSEATDLVGTNWSGTDSDGDFWAFEFQEDQTVAFTFNEDSYDDATDVWSLSGDDLHISIAFTDGEATFDGTYTAGASSIDLAGKQVTAEWTVTITKD
jgi:hypothetical protein